MTTKKNARTTAGKDHSKKIVPHCACCLTEFRDGEPAIKLMFPIGYSRTGNMLCEQMAVCLPCMDRAVGSDTAYAEVLQEIVDNHARAEQQAVGVH